MKVSCDNADPEDKALLARKYVRTGGVRGGVRVRSRWYLAQTVHSSLAQRRKNY